MRFRLLCLVSAAIVCSTTTAAADVAPRPMPPVDPAIPPLTPPVDAAVASAFSAPPHPFGAGHRGIDYAVPEGSSVRAAGTGVVSFAGPVAGHLAIAIDHGSGLETTYSRMSEVFVRQGEEVTAGTWLGRSGDAHGPHVPGLHFGVKVRDEYVDPLKHLGGLDTAGAIALAPLDEDPVEDRHVRACKASADLPEGAPAPNDNVAVVIGGIMSATEAGRATPDLVAAMPTLGYSRARTYLFSYRGVEGPGAHEPYSRSDTFGDIRIAAAKLGDLLREVARVHPGAEVDIVAHSQGGVVGRTYLTQQAGAFDPAQPRVEHFITFASPHRGVPAAGEIDELREGRVGSRLLAAGLDGLADFSDAIPPLSSGSVVQLRTDSELLASLDRQDVLFGTRVLALGIPNDILVPATRTSIRGKPRVTVPAAGVWGHSEILESRRALQIAHAFLGGAGVACAPELGFVERNLPTIIDKGQSLIGEAINGVMSVLRL